MKPTRANDLRLSSLILAACLLLGAAQMSEAQYTNIMRPGSNFTNMYGAMADFTLSQMIQQSQWNMMNAALKKSTQQSPGASREPTSITKMLPPSTASAPLTATDFEPAGPRQAAEQIAANIDNPEERKQVIEICRQIHTTIENTQGFRRNNLAGAMAVLIGVSIQVLMEKEVSDEETDALIQWLNNEVVAVGNVAKMTAEQKTQAYDVMIMISGLIAGISANAAETGDATQAEQARSMARDALKAFGLPLD